MDCRGKLENVIVSELDGRVLDGVVHEGILLRIKYHVFFVDDERD